MNCLEYPPARVPRSFAYVAAPSTSDWRTNDVLCLVQEASRANLGRLGISQLFAMGAAVLVTETVGGTYWRVAVASRSLPIRAYLWGKGLLLKPSISDEPVPERPGVGARRNSTALRRCCGAALPVSRGKSSCVSSTVVPSNVAADGMKRENVENHLTRRPPWRANWATPCGTLTPRNGSRHIFGAVGEGEPMKRIMKRYRNLRPALGPPPPPPPPPPPYAPMAGADESGRQGENSITWLARGPRRHPRRVVPSLGLSGWISNRLAALVPVFPGGEPKEGHPAGRFSCTETPFLSGPARGMRPQPAPRWLYQRRQLLAARNCGCRCHRRGLSWGLILPRRART